MSVKPRIMGKTARHYYKEVRLARCGHWSRLRGMAVSIGSTGHEPAPVQCHIEEIARFHFHLLCPHDHPLAARKLITLDAIARQPLTV